MACAGCRVAGHGEAVKLLLKDMKHRKHEAVNAANMDKDTPLHWVASEGHVSVVKILLEEGAEVNACNKDMNTPLLVACAEGHVEVVKLLLASGANVQMYVLLLLCVCVYVCYVQ